jgi:hypothetical protein
LYKLEVHFTAQLLLGTGLGSSSLRRLGTNYSTSYSGKSCHSILTYGQSHGVYRPRLGGYSKLQVAGDLLETLVERVFPYSLCNREQLCIWNSTLELMEDMVYFD